uniref:Mos1 transposase HTH domain-containing protein n=1 Tax=Caenorhabditis japonica TaxID=281687 RepID=A0A8R1IMX2_CAEJA
MPAIFVPSRIHTRNFILFLFLSDLKNPDIHKKLTSVYKSHAPAPNTIKTVLTASSIKEGHTVRDGRPSSIVC